MVPQPHPRLAPQGCVGGWGHEGQAAGQARRLWGRGLAQFSVARVPRILPARAPVPRDAWPRGSVEGKRAWRAGPQVRVGPRLVRWGPLWASGAPASGRHPLTLAAFGAPQPSMPPPPTQVTSIVSTWVLALGRVLETTSPGPCHGLSLPGWHAPGRQSRKTLGQGHGWAVPAVWPGPMTSALWATDSHLQRGWAARPHLRGPWEQRGGGRPLAHSRDGNLPPPQLTGGQGCHGGGDQALDAQGAEGATQEAAGEGQELGAGDTGHRGQSRGRPTPRGHARLEGSRGEGGPPPSPGVLGLGRGLPQARVPPGTLGASSRYCRPEAIRTRRGKLLSCRT